VQLTAHPLVPLAAELQARGILAGIGRLILILIVILVLIGMFIGFSIGRRRR
jgi:membrane protein DedA with SNARE-associated domain